MEIKELKNKIDQLETELKTTETNLLNAQRSREKAQADATEAKNRLSDAINAVETTLNSIVCNTATTETLATARAQVRNIEIEVADHEAICAACVPVEARLKTKIQELRQQVVLEKKMFWALVAEELEEKTRKAIGSLLLQSLAARELSSWYTFDGGDHCKRIFFANSGPQIEDQKAGLLKKYFS